MVLRSVGVLSAGKVSGALAALGGLIGGGFFALMALLGAAVQPPGGAGDVHLPALFFGVGAVIVLPILYGAFGFIGGVIYAVLYNLIAGVVGGLELNLEPDIRQV